MAAAPNPPGLSSPPMPPQRSDSVNFSARADAFLTWLGGVFPTELTAAMAWMRDAILDLATARNAAEQSAVTASSAAAASNQSAAVASAASDSSTRLAAAAQQSSSAAGNSAISAAASATAAANASRLGIGSVATIPYNQPASVEISGAPGEQILSFSIPSGPPGDSGGGLGSSQVWHYAEYQAAATYLNNRDRAIAIYAYNGAQSINVDSPGVPSVDFPADRIVVIPAGAYFSFNANYGLAQCWELS